MVDSPTKQQSEGRISHRLDRHARVRQRLEPRSRPFILLPSALIKVSVPFRGSGLLRHTVRRGQTLFIQFPSPFGEVVCCDEWLGRDVCNRISFRPLSGKWFVVTGLPAGATAATHCFRPLSGKWFVATVAARSKCPMGIPFPSPFGEVVCCDHAG